MDKYSESIEAIYWISSEYRCLAIEFNLLTGWQLDSILSPRGSWFEDRSPHSVELWWVHQVQWFLIHSIQNRDINPRDNVQDSAISAAWLKRLDATNVQKLWKVSLSIQTANPRTVIELPKILVTSAGLFRHHPLNPAILRLSAIWVKQKANHRFQRGRASSNLADVQSKLWRPLKRC